MRPITPALQHALFEPKRRVRLQVSRRLTVRYRRRRCARRPCAALTAQAAPCQHPSKDDPEENAPPHTSRTLHASQRFHQPRTAPSTLDRGAVAPLPPYFRPVTACRSCACLPLRLHLQLASGSVAFTRRPSNTPSTVAERDPIGGITQEQSRFGDRSFT